jgi:putative ABC transport system ATP-binding protein
MSHSSIEAIAPLAELADVGKTYGEGEAAVHALSGVSFTIRSGDFVAIVGPSGSGKSTAMNIVGALDRPTFGTYLFSGVNVGTLKPDALALLRRHYIGFVFQGFNLLARTTALENVELPLVYSHVPAAQRQEMALAALHRVGLTGREHHLASELSGGQQQRVAIARAIVNRPRLVLADEPTGNLDTARRDEIMSLLTSLNREHGITVVIVTHATDIACWAARIIEFRNGLVWSEVSSRSRRL